MYAIGGDIEEDLPNSNMFGVNGISVSSWLLDPDVETSPKGLEFTVYVILASSVYSSG